MTNTAHRTIPAALRRSGIRTLTATAMAVAVSSCSIDDILDVDDVDVATPASLRGPEALPVVLGGAVANFQFAYFGSGNVNESSGQIGYSGLLADEIRSSDTFPTRNDIDQRTIQLDNSSNEAQFIRLSQARASADLAIRRFEEFGPDEPGLALAYALDGYSTIMFGENYCSGVPFSRLTDEGNTEYGMPLTTAEIFQRAVTKFDAALALPVLDEALPTDPSDEEENRWETLQSYKHLALLGKARAHLDLGEYAAASTAASQVPADFEYLVAASATTNRQNNGVWTFFQNTQRFSLSDNEGINGLPFLSAGDPRVPFTPPPAPPNHTGFDDFTPYAQQELYPERDSDVPLATGIEAQLIVAEAQLAGATAGDWLATLNAIRTANGMAGDLTDPGTAATRQDLLFRERAFWLFLTSHRLGDLRRLIRPVASGGYGRTEDAVFPTGNWHKGGLYGDDTSMPVPVVETNNPNFTGCLD